MMSMPKVVVRNQKLYLNRVEGFIGTSLRKMNIYVTAQTSTMLLFLQRRKNAGGQG